VEQLATKLAAIPGVVAVTLGGSRASNTAVEGSDWDFGLYYRGRLDPADIVALGWPGRVFAPGEWGRIVNGGAWLTIEGTKVDLIYRDLDEVLRWTAAAEDGRFEIDREVGYVAGIATYVLAGELALAGYWPVTCPARGSRRSCSRPRRPPGPGSPRGRCTLPRSTPGARTGWPAWRTCAKRCWVRPRAAWRPLANGCSTKNGLPNVPGWAAFKASPAGLSRTWVRSCPASGPLSN
jgi:hypothetical protein